MTVSYLHKIIIIPLLCQYGLFIYIHVFLKMWLFNVIRWSSHMYKKSSFLLFHGLLFLGNNTREGTLIKCDTSSWNKKCHYASDILFEWLVDMFFYCHIITSWEKVTPHQLKVSYVSGIKTPRWRFSWIYRNLLYKWSENAVLGDLQMVQCKLLF